MTSELANKNDYRRLFDLSGRIAVVTGGTGILGRHFCAALADHGAEVAIVDRDAQDVQEFSAELEMTYGQSARGFAIDLADIDAIAPLIAQIETQMGPISVLHNNAASKGTSLDRFFSPVATFDIETWREIMAVNLDAAFVVAREVGERMAQRGGGSIIQTASIYGVAGPDQRIYEGSSYLGREINTPPVYSASKAGIVGLTQYLATYWGSRSVRVNSLTPGGVSSGQNDIFDGRYSARVPLGRMATADEMTGALIFLASDASAYVTGQNLIVDGGLTAW